MTIDEYYTKIRNKFLITNPDKVLSGYKLACIEENCYWKPYKGIDSRADSIQSSAAMIFNFLGPDKGIINFDSEKYSVTYEKELRCFRGGKGATLDGYLISENEENIILIEAKFREWMCDTPRDLVETYLNVEKYMNKLSSYEKEVFLNFFKRLTKSPSHIEHKTERYDAIQMAIHIFGAFNSIYKRNTHIKSIRVINFVCGTACSEYSKEHEEAEKFIELVNMLIKPLFKNIQFSVEYNDFNQFIQHFDYTNKEDYRNYLERYNLN